MTLQASSTVLRGHELFPLQSCITVLTLQWPHQLWWLTDLYRIGRRGNWYLPVHWKHRLFQYTALSWYSCTFSRVTYHLRNNNHLVIMFHWSPQVEVSILLRGYFYIYIADPDMYRNRTIRFLNWNHSLKIMLTEMCQCRLWKLYQCLCLE